MANKEQRAFSIRDFVGHDATESDTFSERIQALEKSGGTAAACALCGDHLISAWGFIAARFGYEQGSSIMQALVDGMIGSGDKVAGKGRH